MSSRNKDKETLIAIARIYCSGNHRYLDKNAADLCFKCASIVDTVVHQALQCPHNHKHNCEDCQAKCSIGQTFKTEVTLQDIREMMSYAAVRMLWHHPIMMLQYLTRKIRYKLICPKLKQ